MNSNDKKLCDGCVGKMTTVNFGKYSCNFSGPRNNYYPRFVKNAKCPWFFPVRKIYPLKYKIMELINSLVMDFGFAFQINFLQTDLLFINLRNIIGGKYENGYYYLGNRNDER